MLFFKKSPLADTFQTVLAEVSSGQEASLEQPADLLRVLSNLSLPLGDTPSGIGASAYFDDDLERTTAEADQESFKIDEPLPSDSTLREAIISELGLARLDSIDALDRTRRDFMWRHHPDRFFGQARIAATKRASIANSLLDEARRRLERSSKSRS